MRAARFSISGELLREVLHIPKTAFFTSASVNEMVNADVVTFVVHDPGFPEAAEPHESSPSVTVREMWLDRRVDWHWNIPPVAPGGSP